MNSACSHSSPAVEGEMFGIEPLDSAEDTCSVGQLVGVISAGLLVGFVGGLTNWFNSLV